MSTTILDRWADILLEALDTKKPGATLVRLERVGGEEHELALLPVDVHPTEALAVLDLPESCYAVGVATGGWAAPMDGRPGRPSGHPDARRVFQVVLVDRAGAVVSRVRFPDGSIMKEPPGHGAILDALRAALGLPAAA